MQGFKHDNQSGFIHAPSAGRQKVAPSEKQMVALLEHEIERLGTRHHQQEWAYENAPRILAEAATRITGNRWADRFLRAAAAAGMNPPMAREAARNLFPKVTLHALGRMWDSVVQADDDTSLLMPGLIFHVLAGNLWLSGIESITTGMLTGSPNLVRCSSADREMPRLFLDVVAETDPRFADHCVATWWPAEWEECTTLCAGAADAVMAFGDDSSVASIREKTPVSARFAAHGHRLSVALVDLDYPGNWARELAYDFSVYDQQGCLSPRAAFLKSCSREAADAFASQLCREMRLLTRRFPVSLDLGGATELNNARSNAAMSKVIDGKISLVSSTEDPFVVTISEETEWVPGCLNRFCDLRLVHSWHEVSAQLQPFIGRISTLALGELDPEIMDLADYLRVTRICRVGMMQKPLFGISHDGVSDLPQIVRSRIVEISHGL